MVKGKKASKKLKSDFVIKKYPIVTSDVCEACTTPCSRGTAYKLRMREPGAIGKGVVCKKEAK